MVAVATRREVLAAVEAIGFVPNRSARQLVSGRTGAIGVIVPDITNPYFATILRAIQADARGQDISVLIADTHADADEERRALAKLGRQVDGLVVLTPLTDLSCTDVPVVQVNRQSQLAPSVVVDQAAIIGLAVDHLSSLGHRHLAVVRGPAPYWSTGQRVRAVTLLARNGADDGVRLDLVGPSPGTFDGGREVFAAARATGATGIVAFNDVQAAGLLVEAHAAGVSVPDDLSVVGSDGLDLAAMTSPPLTTVAAPLVQIGIVANARLGRSMADQDGPRRTVLQPELVHRASSAPPPTGRRPSNRPRSSNGQAR
jgi:DNA-binding LacI/PurR family transcriptional regulator